MHKLFLATAAAIAFATPSAAYAGEVYAGISGGLSLPSDSNNSGEFDATVPATADWPAIPADTDLDWDTDFDNGFALSGQLGYAFDAGFRVELEVAYSEYDVDSHEDLAVGGAIIDGVDVAVLTRAAPDPANPTVGEVISDGQGDVSNFGLFANVYYDVETGSSFKPYVGAGLGYQWVDVDFSPSGVGVADDDDGSFAFQLMAGAGFEISDNAELFGQYTYRSNTEDADVDLDLLPATLGVESDQSIFSFGVRFRFGG